MSRFSSCADLLRLGLFGLVPDQQGAERGTGGDHDQQEPCQAGEAGHLGIAAAPTPDPLRPAHRPGLDRFPVDEPPQVVGQFLRPAVTLARLLMQAFQADGLQVVRHFDLQLARRHRLVTDDLQGRVQRRFRLERAAGR